MSSSPRRRTARPLCSRPNPKLSASAGLDRRRLTRATLDQSVKKTRSAPWAPGRRHDDRRPSAGTLRRRAGPARRREPRTPISPTCIRRSTPHEAHVEADRCYFCFDAPCQQACPTSIDIPLFIRQIAAGQSARRGADDPRRQHHGRHVRARLPDRDAVRGGLRARGRRGQAGAHRPAAAPRGRRADGDAASSPSPAARRRASASRSSAPARRASPARTRSRSPAIEATIFEAREKPGGLNEYGIAAYKTPDDFAAREAAFILSIGGIEVKHGVALGRDVTLDELRRDYDAVFLGVGLGATTSSGSPARTRSPTSSTRSTISPSCGRRRI